MFSATEKHAISTIKLMLYRRVSLVVGASDLRGTDIITKTPEQDFPSLLSILLRQSLQRKTETHDAEPWDYHQHVLLCINWKCQSIWKQKAGYLFTAIILCLTIGSGRGPEARSVRRCVCQHCHRPVAVLSNKIPSKQWPSRFPICFPSLFLYALAILSDTAVKWGGKGAGHRERGRGCSHLPIHTAGVLSRSLCKVHV